MKKINLLPKPTFFEQYKWFIVTCTVTLLIASGLYGLFTYLAVGYSDLGSAIFSSAEKSQLSKYPVHRLKMIGYLSKTDRNIGLQSVSLIQAPDGQIITLSVGDMLGSEGLKVIAIQSDSTCFSDPRQSESVVLRMNTLVHE